MGGYTIGTLLAAITPQTLSDGLRSRGVTLHWGQVPGFGFVPQGKGSLLVSWELHNLKPEVIELVTDTLCSNKVFLVLGELRVQDNHPDFFKAEAFQNLHKVRNPESSIVVRNLDLCSLYQHGVKNLHQLFSLPVNVVMLSLDSVVFVAGFEGLGLELDFETPCWIVTTSLISMTFDVLLFNPYPFPLPFPLPLPMLFNSG